MRLELSDGVSKYYVQTLSMIFFPGEKFPENGGDEEYPAARVTLSRTDEYVSASVSLSVPESTAYSVYTLRGEQLAEAGDMAEKIAVGGAFLSAGCAVCGIIPPWGMLTGVRPAKVASAMLESGILPAEAVEKMKRMYLLSSRKAALAVNVSLAERRIITPASLRECSVYIAIPFCPSRCSYCSFVSYTSEKLLRLIPDYLNCLTEDIRRTAALISSLGLSVSTVYIGGGTPTVLDEHQLGFLLYTVNECFDIASLDEFTLEAGRPDTITAAKLSAAARSGVTRISVNTQTLNDDILASIGRRHTANQFFEAYRIAEDSGIGHINVDLIAGLPGESAASFADAVERIAALHPDNVTVHTFCVKKSAQIKSDDAGIYRREGVDAERAVDSSQNILELAGYMPYYMYRQKNTVGNLENVGYALPGCEGLYNVYMMEEVHTIFAAGASAVTKLVRRDGSELRIERIFENKYPYEYLRERHDGRYEKVFRENEEKIRRFYLSF